VTVVGVLSYPLRVESIGGTTIGMAVLWYVGVVAIFLIAFVLFLSLLTAHQSTRLL
jgi:hypothetical protein